MALVLWIISVLFALVISSLFLKYLRSGKTVRPKELLIMSHDDDADVIIIGGGPVGATLAATFGRQQRRVVCIESNLEEPEKEVIIGELLQPGGYEHLKKLGLGAATEGIDGTVVRGYAVYYKGQKIQLPYPDLSGTGETPTGRAFRYGKFVTNLRNMARKHQSVQMIEGTATKLIEENNVIRGVEYKLKENNENVTVRAPLTIVCNGARSRFSKVLTTAELSVASRFLAVELEDAARKLPYPEHGHVVITEQGPVIIYPIGPSIVRVLIDFPNDKLPDDDEAPVYIKNVVVPQLPEQIRPLVVAEVDKMVYEKRRFLRAENREMAAEPRLKSGAVLIGDAYNCRHPVTGGGMTVAFGDCYMLNELIGNADWTNLAQMDKLMDQYYQERKRVAATINILANSMYSIFASRQDDNPMVDEMKQAVFQYFMRGGSCVTGSVGLLGGLIHNPNVLLTHFFSVVFYYCFHQLFPCPTPASLYRSIRMLRAATNIVGPHVADENILRYLFPPLVFQRAK